MPQIDTDTDLDDTSNYFRPPAEYSEILMYF